MSSELVSEDLLTQRARTIWSAADFLPIARSFAAGAQAFVARLALARGEPVLDVACGTGNLALPAARAGARVTGIDIAPNLIAHARAEALSAGLSIRYDLGDAEDLPYEEGEFDTTVSMFGMMFCYRPERATDELLRVTMPGGRIALATWTPEGFVGEMLRAHTAVVAPPPGVPSPLLWGVESVVQERFGARVRALDCTRRTLELRFALPPAQVTELFATCYGPTVAALKVAGREGAAELRASLTRLFSEHNSATDGGTVIVAEYLDVQARVA
ncbi:MAG TPA: class I SAM-dependent methyltransferase [Gemmatimonadales bacterium]|nr:class I SAM-dependent methyltransferase [Gemmatimonadales bacterium]